MNAFWIVWNPQGQNPKHRHANPELARKEAERLAFQNPGQEFIVMLAIGKAIKRDVDWVEVNEDDLPF